MHLHVRLLLLSAFVLTAQSQSNAQQKSDAASGKIINITGYGVGMSKTCGAFVRETEERDTGQALEYEGKRYFPERRLYFEWLSGFFTARSVARQPEVSGQPNMDDMVSWLRKYCEAHPLEDFLTATTKLVGQVSTKQ